MGQLNADEIFYMRSRGIPENEAKTLQMLSFLSPVIPAGREEEVEFTQMSVPIEVPEDDSEDTQ